MKLCPICGCECDDEARFCPRDGAGLPECADPMIGRVLMGQFEVLESCGQGATGTVYRARQTPMDRIVAVKFLKQEFAKEPKVVRRFHREAKASARLTHANIITVHLVGETEAGVPYLVMEYLEGEDLDSVCKREGSFSVGRAARITAQIADALAEAHENDVVHRDLKPANIKLCPRRNCADFVKVLDFGIAKILEGEADRESRLTQTGTVFGTPYYLAPEQASGDDVDHRADIYSLGVILYQMSTGRLPFGSKSGLQVLVQHIKDTPPSPRSVRPELPAALDGLIMRCLEKERDKRFQRADELAAELRALTTAAGEPSGERPERPAGRKPARSGETLDMTGWQKSSPSQQVKNKAAEEKGTIFGVGGVRPVLPAKPAMPGKPAKRAKPGEPEAARPAPGPVSQMAARPQKKAEQSNSPSSVEASAGQGEPATDSVTGKATAFGESPAMRIQAAPAPYQRPAEPKPAMAAPPESPSVTGPEVSAGPGAAAPVSPAHPAPGQGDPHGVAGESDGPPMAEASAQPGWHEEGDSNARVERSAWGGEQVDSVASEFGAPGVGRSKTLGVIGVVVALAIVALGAGAYFVLKDREGVGAAQSDGGDEAAGSTSTGRRAESDASAEESDDLEDRGPGSRPARRVIRGKTLDVGDRRASVEAGGFKVGLELRGRLAGGRSCAVALSIVGADDGKAAGEVSDARLQLVDSEGQVRHITLDKGEDGLSGDVRWPHRGLHRLVLRFRSGDQPATVWFAVPIRKGRGAQRESSRRRRRSRRESRMRAAHENSPFVDPPTPPDARRSGMKPARERPARQQPRPRPMEPDLSGGGDLPPPPPDSL